MQTIELDCAPGNPRPDDLIEGVIAGLLPQKDPISKLFGNWTWDYSDVSPEKWQEVQPTLKERITALYHGGFIRYGSW